MVEMGVNDPSASATHLGSAMYRAGSHEVTGPDLRFHLVELVWTLPGQSGKICHRY